MSGEVMYGSNPYYQYPEYNNTQNPQQQHDQTSGYFGYDHQSFQQTQSQPVDPSVGEPFNPLSSYQGDWIPSGGYDSFNPDGSWPIGSGQQNYGGSVSSQVYTNQAVNNGTTPNQVNESYFPSFVDEVPISDLIESVYKDVNLPSPHSQSWNQTPNIITDTGHRPSNQLYNNLVSPVDGGHHLGSNFYSQHHAVSSYHQQEPPTPSTALQELSNNNLVPSSNSNYLVCTPGYVLSQLESSTLPDVTTTQSQLSQNVSPIPTSSLHSSAIDPSSSLVIEVTAFKCKCCDFLSLDKSTVFNHVNTSHKSGGQIINNNGTDQVVNQSMVPSSITRGNEFTVPSQGAKSSASNNLATHVNNSTSIVTVTPKTVPVITSKQPVSKGVKLAPKVMPPILVVTKQTKSSILSSMNPSNHSSIVPTTIVLKANNNLQNCKDSKSSKTNHSKEVLKHRSGEQGNETTDPSHLKSKGGRKSSKSKVKQLKEVKKEGSHLFHCSIARCSAKFVSEANLERHIRCHVLGDGLGFRCTSCDMFSSQNWSTMAGHLWREHAVDLELHKCEFCNYRSYSLSILENQHKKIHSNEKNYVCDTCCKGFKNYKQLVNHRVRHVKVQQVPQPVPAESNNVVTKPECDICKKFFKNRRALMVHKNGVHPKKTRPFVCSSCGHRASSRGALRTHVRSHTGEKPFKCDNCHYSTSDHNSLRRHKMTHSGERPYKCPLCDYASIQSCTFKQHLRRKHPGQIDGLMFTCSNCGFKTVNSENYSTHIRENGATCGFNRNRRSDGESSSYSSSSSPATPALNGPESPDMHLVRGILGVSSVKDLHSLKRPSSSSSSTSPSSEDDCSLGGVSGPSVMMVPATSASTATTLSFANFNCNQNSNINGKVVDSSDVAMYENGNFLDLVTDLNNV